MSYWIHVIYSYFEKNERYRTNLIYFLKYGYLNQFNIDYTFVINGSHSVVFPNKPNLRVIERENRGFDFKGYHTGIINSRRKYDYYIFINSTVRGPFIPPYAQSQVAWYQPFIQLITPKHVDPQSQPVVKLVGPTINIQSASDQLRIPIGTFAPHVQSFCFAMDDQCLDYLMNSTKLFTQQFDDKMEVIINQEIGMSTLVLQHGWNISCLVPEYQGIDYRQIINIKIKPTDRDHNGSISRDPSLIDDVLWSHNSVGREIHPYEIIFMKTERDMTSANDFIRTISDYNLNVNDMCYSKQSNASVGLASTPSPHSVATSSSSSSASRSDLSIAICFHLGYPHLYPQFVEYIRNVYRSGSQVDLYVTYQTSDPIVQDIAREFPQTIFIEAKRGVDTGAFLLQLEYIATHPKQKKYDYIFKIHTKKNEQWRAELLDQLAGSPEQVKTIYQIFQQHANIGMISGHQKWIHHVDKYNEPLINEICQRLNINIDDKSRFVAGTIFWTRWSIFERFIKDSSINFQSEYQLCELTYLVNSIPTYMHSWERIFGYIVTNYNFQITSTTIAIASASATAEVILNKNPAGTSTSNLNHKTKKSTSTSSPASKSQSQPQHLFRIKQILYGVSEHQAIDITSKIKTQQLPLVLDQVNTYNLWGDPFPEKRKMLIIILEHEGRCVIHECSSQLLPYPTPNYFSLRSETQASSPSLSSSSSSLVLNWSDCQETEKTISIQYNLVFGRYQTTFFDWLYYYQQHRNDISVADYDHCLDHYRRIGLTRRYLPFEPAVSLLNKYQIKCLVDYLPYYQSQMFEHWQPLFKGHHLCLPQQRTEYDPGSIETLKSSFDTAKQYGLSGFCFHHYWENGNSMYHQLEQNLLKLIQTKSICLPFCFAWICTTTMYNRDDWSRHFKYLLPFFQSTWYLKHNGQPVLVLNWIANNPKMITYWNQLAQQTGFKGIYLILRMENHQKITTFKDQHLTFYNPLYTLFHRHNYHKLLTSHNESKYRLLNYQHISQVIGQQNVTNSYRNSRGQNLYFDDLFIGFDNSSNPRNKYQIICHKITPKAIYCYLKRLLEITLSRTHSLEQRNHQDFPAHHFDQIIFIHCWNDYENQMVLDPKCSLTSSNSKVCHCHPIDKLSAISNAIYQYHNPQPYNKWCDFFN